MKKPVIAIDGNAASGKGTLARGLAAALGYAHMDTGSLYRLVALRMIEQGDPAAGDEAAAIAAAQHLNRVYKPEDSDNPRIRTDEVGRMASSISALPRVRQEILDLQRQFATSPPGSGAILDGRDIGTVVCPQADMKFFVTAAPEERAQRRFKELQSKGILCTYDAVLADMRERDARDAGRETAPMKPADDAIIFDTGSKTIEQVLEEALSLIRRRIRL